MAKNEDDKKDLTNRQLQRRAADLMYAMGNTIGGQRPAGGFASIGGMFAYGTHRDGRPGVLWGGKFVPITRKSALDYGFDSSLYGKGDGNGDGDGDGGNNLNNRPDEDEEGLDKKPIRNKPRVPRGASWNQIVGAYFPRTREPRKDNQNKTMKEGGLVRGAGKAERGRGRGKMV